MSIDKMHNDKLKISTEEIHSHDDGSYMSKTTVIKRYSMRIKAQASETKNKDTLLPSSAEL